MPRPVKLRSVDSLPNNCHFGPLDNLKNNFGPVLMTVEEYETIRLIDLENLTQEECSKKMNVARTTVQGIYNSARCKLAEVLVNGRTLKIQGGDYKICKNGCHGQCHKRQCMQEIEKSKENNMEKVSYVAIPADENSKDSTVCMSYGRTPYFALMNISTGEIVDFMDNSAAACSGGAGILASQSLIDSGVKVVVTPRIGQNAADVLKAANIQILKTTEGNILDNLTAYKNGELKELTNIHPGFHKHEAN